jgi:subtilisin family serine protease
MKYKFYFASIIAIIALALASCSENNTNPVTIQDSGTGNTPPVYIVVLNDNIGVQIQSGIDYTQTAKSILESHNIPNDAVTAIYDNVIKGFAAKLTGDQLNMLKADSRIKLIEKDQPVYLDDWVLPTNPKDATIQAQTIPWGITAVGGSVNAGKNTTISATIPANRTTGVAWIIDTGIDFTHPDLYVNTALSKTFITTGADSINANDLNGHGTHCAGIIAAINNSYGVVGVCAGASVVPVKVFDMYGSGTMSKIISGVNYVANHLVSGKINVVNMSLGGSAYALLDNAVIALANAGAYVVIAAGNAIGNANDFSPSRVNGTRIYTISAYDANGSFASFSNYGSSVDYSAPGVNIYSTYKNGGYTTMSGTSMAAPHVAGILLANNGTIHTKGFVTNDPDGDADFKAYR